MAIVPSAVTKVIVAAGENPRDIVNSLRVANFLSEKALSDLDEVCSRVETAKRQWYEQQRKNMEFYGAAPPGGGPDDAIELALQSFGFLAKEASAMPGENTKAAPGQGWIQRIVNLFLGRK